VNTGLFVLVIVLAWSVLSVVVALAVGAMARARDLVGVAPPGFRARDEGVRSAV
jgi:hypothetical protein